MAFSPYLVCCPSFLEALQRLFNVFTNKKESKFSSNALSHGKPNWHSGFFFFFPKWYSICFILKVKPGNCRKSSQRQYSFIQSQVYKISDATWVHGMLMERKHKLWRFQRSALGNVLESSLNRLALDQTVGLKWTRITSQLRYFAWLQNTFIMTRWAPEGNISDLSTGKFGITTDNWQDSIVVLNVAFHNELS